MNPYRENKVERPPAYRSMLRAFIERLRLRPGRKDGPRDGLGERRDRWAGTSEGGGTAAHSRQYEVRARWHEIARGLHDPDQPLVLDEEGSREVLDEIENGSPLTPERAATFARMRAMAGVRGQQSSPAEDPEDPRRAAIRAHPELVDTYRRTPTLSPEGVREIEAEMACPPLDTPGRRALFERVEARAAMRRRMVERDGA